MLPKRYDTDVLAYLTAILTQGRFRVTRPERQEFPTISRDHFNLMVDLSGWMPTVLQFCMYCGIWKTLCVPRADEEPVICRNTRVYEMLSGQEKPLICLTCQSEGKAKLPHVFRLEFLTSSGLDQSKEYRESSRELRKMFSDSTKKGVGFEEDSRMRREIESCHVYLRGRCLRSLVSPTPCCV